MPASSGVVFPTLIFNYGSHGRMEKEKPEFWFCVGLGFLGFFGFFVPHLII